MRAKVLLMLNAAGAGIAVAALCFAVSKGESNPLCVSVAVTGLVVSCIATGALMATDRKGVFHV